MQSLRHMCHVTNCQNFGHVSFYVKYYCHPYNNYCSFVDSYKILALSLSLSLSLSHTHTHTHTHTLLWFSVFY